MRLTMSAITFRMPDEPYHPIYGVTHARYPSIALLFWLWHHQPEPDELLGVYGGIPVYKGKPRPSDLSSIFLKLVAGEVERQWNQTIPYSLLEPTEEELGGQAYQDLCKKILEWLHERGHIKDLVFGAED